MALDVSLEVPVEFSLNGERVKVEGVDPHTTLLDWVRSRGLTGSKEGCAEGECGACTVVWVRQGLEGAYYQAVNSCLLLLPMLEGQEVYTVEALAQEGGLAPVQQAMVRTGGSQCGYCTPGFVMSIFAEQYRRGEREFDIEALHGNLCRCTGYRPIQDAARSLAPVEAGDPFRQRLKLPPPALKEAHYRADGGYFYRPEKLKDAVAYLWQNPGAKVVAGGTDLAVEANLRYSRWERMVGLEALDELKIFQDTQSVLELGAGLSLSEIEAYVHAMLDAPQALQEWFKLFASPLIRNRATLGGNLATASPIGDSAPLLLALGAQARLASAKGERTGGSQCGYCTPGFVMSIFAEQYRRGEREFDIEALHGNLCRCTGYRPIQDAARSLAPVEAGDPFRQRLKLPPPALKEAHYRADGGYFYRPEKLKDAVAYLWQNPGAKVVAGGTDLAVEANLRYSRWERMVGLEALDELKIFQDTQSVLELGAGLSLSEIEAYVHAMLDAPQALQEWFKLFASPLIRNRATLGGNLATASPIGDSAPLLLALGAQARLASAKGERKIPLDQFFLGYRKTALQAGELVVSILLPKPFPKRSRFYKIAKRKADDISSVAFAIALDLTADQKVQNIRLGLGGVAATPIRALEAEQVLRGETWGLDAVRKAQALLGETLKPIDDHRASARYRLEMTQKLLEKFYFETAGEVPA
ncbi:MAG: FAD binding domain-containing protein [Deinococcus sp.]|nr:FAD binding domain-containing protein [Deinococcus sp.]